MDDSQNFSSLAGIAELDAEVLEVQGLQTHFFLHGGVVKAVDGVDLRVGAGEIVGLVGESGSGKTITGFSVIGLVDAPGRVVGGSIRFLGEELVGAPESRLQQLRGKENAMIFQDPMMTLNPVLRVDTQMVEAIHAHEKVSAAAALARARDALAMVGIPSPGERLLAYPHQLSGGMRQRVAIAIALSCEPKLLIADEPTTALDVTIQAQILDLLAREQRRRHMAMILITHDLGVVAGRTDEVAVMYAGRVVERAPTSDLFKKMRMPYTEALLAALPKIDAAPHTPLPAISGRPPDPTRPLAGCSFSPRCRYADDRCRREKPPLAGPESPPHPFACFHPLHAEAGTGA
jgi:peptide/nickel transport system ATP-binding protein